jgi:hypothetical protein
MFAFNPTVQDRSGELIAQGMNNAATMQLQGMQSLGNALSGLGETYARTIQKSEEKNSKMQGTMKALTAMGNLSGQYGTRGAAFQKSLAEDLNNLGEKPKPNDVAGVAMAYFPLFENLVAADRTQAQADIWNNYRKSSPETDTTAPGANPQAKQDANFVRQFYSTVYKNYADQPGMSHDKAHAAAISDMNSAGLSWGLQFIEPQQGMFR